jgi:hypothetical protein
VVKNIWLYAINSLYSVKFIFNILFMKFLKPVGVGIACLASALTLSSFHSNISNSVASISHYVIRGGIYIMDGTAITNCGYEAYNSQIRLEEIDGELTYSKAYAIFDYPIWWSDPIIVGNDIDVDVSHSGTIDYCECWIKHDPVGTIEKRK